MDKVEALEMKLELGLEGMVNYMVKHNSSRGPIHALNSSLAAYVSNIIKLTSKLSEVPAIEGWDELFEDKPNYTEAELKVLIPRLKLFNEVYQECYQNSYDTKEAIDSFMESSKKGRKRFTTATFKDFKKGLISVRDATPSDEILEKAKQVFSENYLFMLESRSKNFPVRDGVLYTPPEAIFGNNAQEDYQIHKQRLSLIRAITDFKEIIQPAEQVISEANYNARYAENLIIHNGVKPEQLVPLIGDYYSIMEHFLAGEITLGELKASRLKFISEQNKPKAAVQYRPELQTRKITRIIEGATKPIINKPSKKHFKKGSIDKTLETLDYNYTVEDQDIHIITSEPLHELYRDGRAALFGQNARKIIDRTIGKIKDNPTAPGAFIRKNAFGNNLAEIMCSRYDLPEGTAFYSIQPIKRHRAIYARVDSNTFMLLEMMPHRLYDKFEP